MPLQPSTASADESQASLQDDSFLRIAAPWLWRGLALAGGLVVALLLIWNVLHLGSSRVWGIGTALMVALPVRFPFHALLIAAGVLPVAGFLSPHAGLPLAWTEPLVLALIAGWLLSIAINRPIRRIAARMRHPLLLFAALVTTSIAVELAVQPMLLGRFTPPFAHYIMREYLTDRLSFPAVPAGVLLLQGLALVAMTGQLVDTDRRWRQLAAMLAFSGVAGALINSTRFAETVLRTGEGLEGVRRLAFTLRINSLHVDVNAAGSFFVLTLFLAGGFATSRKQAIAWGPAVLIIAAALWLTGSRTSTLTTALVIVITTAAHAVRGWSWRRALGAACVVLSIATALLTVHRAYPDKFGAQPAVESLSVRREMAMTSWRMVHEQPLFGIGVGRYYGRSSEFMSPWALTQYPRENAHNQFLQILGELGIVGLGAFLWLLAVASVTRPSPALARQFSGLRLGMLGFLLTCMAGHPLLIRDVAYPFFIALGLLAAGTVDERVRIRASFLAQRRRWHLAIVTVVAVLLASIPFRARISARSVDLEHVSFGMSRWSPASGGPRIRSVGRHAVFFVQADARGVELPLRAKQPFDPPATVEIHLNGRLGDRIVLPPDGWRPYRLVLGAQPQHERFHRVDLFVTAPGWKGDQVESDAGVELGWLKLIGSSPRSP
jgi:O-antigen ligase